MLMHSPETIEQHGGTPVSTAVLDQTDHSVHWKECLTCGRIKPYGQYRRDSSYREGFRDQCLTCEQSPRLSTNEHATRLREMNNNSWAVKRQRWEHQDELYDDFAREGRRMHHTRVLGIVQQLVPSLYVTEGRIIGDLAIYRTYPGPQTRLNGADFEYMFYCPMGWMPEFSQYEFNERDVPVREKTRGWRTILLRLIKSGLLTEEQVNQHFGRADGPGASRYNRELQRYRNRSVTG